MNVSRTLAIFALVAGGLTMAGCASSKGEDSATSGTEEELTSSSGYYLVRQKDGTFYVAPRE